MYQDKKKPSKRVSKKHPRRCFFYLFGVFMITIKGSPNPYLFLDTFEFLFPVTPHFLVIHTIEILRCSNQSISKSLSLFQFPLVSPYLFLDTFEFLFPVTPHFLVIHTIEILRCSNQSISKSLSLFQFPLVSK